MERYLSKSSPRNAPFSIRRDHSTSKKDFIFLYPEPEIINFELLRGSHVLFRLPRQTKLDTAKGIIAAVEGLDDNLKPIFDEYKKVYKTMLNACIDLRYRSNGFTINFALLDGDTVSDAIDIKDGDRTVYVGMTAETHRKERGNGKFKYPNNNHILRQIGEPQLLRVAGFHLWDCVDKLARRAYRNGIDVLVDEDLTELFVGRLNDGNFKPEKYPTFYLTESLKDSPFLDHFIHIRKNRPWLWQYSELSV